MGQPFVEMELLTGIGRYRPGEALTQREHWFATSCKGPIVEVTPVGVVCEPLRVSRPGDGRQLSVSIRFGVFYLGTLQVSLLDVQGKTLYAAEPKAVNPCFEYVFNAALPNQAAAEHLVLEVFDYRHNKVGELARAKLR
jgi:hypothetical protein